MATKGTRRSDPVAARPDRSVSIRDVARAAGVSVATVSRALGPNADDVQMRPETRNRVLHASEELGYRPNDLARALLHQRTSVIGLVVPDISNVYYSGLVHGVEDVASGAGYRVVLCNTNRDVKRMSGYLDTLVKSRVDGVIIAGGGTDSSFDRRVLRQYRTKIVTVGRHGLSAPSVQIDNQGAALAVTEHLLGLGHSRIAFLAGPLGSHTVQDRLAGYHQALAAGLPGTDGTVAQGELDEPSGYRGAVRLLTAGIRPTALICANDRIAFGALAAAVDCGISVPGQVSVVGFDNVSASGYLRPALTTVSIPTHEIGSAAAKLMLEQLAGEGSWSAGSPDGTVGDPVLLPTHLIVRQSSGPPPVRVRVAHAPATPSVLSQDC